MSDEIARERWNALADRWNQWEDLAQDERDALIAAQPYLYSVASNQAAPQSVETLSEAVRVAKHWVEAGLSGVHICTRGGVG